MTAATAAVLGLLLQMYPVSGLPQGLSRPAATKPGSTGATSSTTAMTAANKSLLLVLNQHSKPNLVININNNNNYNGGVVIGGGFENCGNNRGCSRSSTKGSTTPSKGAPTTTPTAAATAVTTSATATSSTAATSTRAGSSTTSAGGITSTTTTKTGETTTATSSTKDIGYLLIMNHASSNVIVLEPPGSADKADDARGPGINTRRPTPLALVTSAADDEDAKAAATKSTGTTSTASSAKHSAVTTAKHKVVTTVDEEDVKAGVSKTTTGASSTETSTKHPKSTTAMHKVVSSADEEDVKAGVTKSTAGPTSAATTSIGTSTKPASSTTVKRTVVASTAGGCQTMVEEPEGEQAADVVSAKAKLVEVCQVQMKSEEAAEETAARKLVPRPAAVMNVRVVAEASGCEISVKSVTAAEDGHEDMKARSLRTRAVDVRVVASPGGCNVDVKSEAGTALEGKATTSRWWTRPQYWPSSRPSSRVAFTMHLAVLPQPSGGCHVHVRADDDASHQDADDKAHAKHGGMGVHITPYRTGAGCRVELARGQGSGQGSKGSTSPMATKTPSNKAAKASTAPAQGKTSLPPSGPGGHGAGKEDDDADLSR
ncbi:mucin-19-like [Thrips palmi]|uniref:Mucin-19-like n=1 Tax=Thrips palmi TaxID=161013 RepID=A0A6P9A6A8_THRPL|nr:mucin-19-like [Thrips palmi]